jgi:hypothetical protein
VPFSYPILSDASGALHRACRIRGWPVEVAVVNGRVASVAGDHGERFERSVVYAAMARHAGARR